MVNVLNDHKTDLYFKTKKFDVRNLDDVVKDNDENIDKISEFVYGGFGIFELRNNRLELVRGNKSLLKTLGIEDNDVEILNFYDYLDNDNKKILYEAFSESIDTNKYTYVKFSCFKTNGNKILLESNIKYLGTGKGNPLIALSFIDATIKAKNDNYETVKNNAMLDIIPAKVCFASIPLKFKDISEYRVLSFNNDKLSVNGYTNEEYFEICQEDLFALVHPGDKEMLKNKVNEFSINKLPFTAKYRVKVKDSDTYKMVSLLAKVAMITDDTIYFTLAFMDVISDDTLMKESLQQNSLLFTKSYLKELYDNYPDMIIQLMYIDGMFKPLLCNKKVLETMKVKDEDEFFDMFNKNPFPFTLPEDKVNTSKTLLKVLNSKEPTQYTGKFINTENEMLYVNCAAYPTTNYDGNDILHIIITDMTADNDRNATRMANNFASIFSMFYECIYSVNVDTNTAIAIKGIRGELNEKITKFNKKLNKFIDEYVYEEDISEAKVLIDNMYNNTSYFSNESITIKLYKDGYLSDQLVVVNRTGYNSFILAYTEISNNTLLQNKYVSLKKEFDEISENEKISKTGIEELGISLIQFSEKGNYISQSLSNYNIYKCKNIEEFKSFDNLVSKQDSLAFATFIDELERLGQAETTLRLKTVGGEYLYHTIAIKKIVDAGGTISYSGYAKNINQIKLTTEAANARNKVMAERNKVLGVLMNKLPVGIGVYEIEGCNVYPVYLNNQLLDMLDISYSLIDRQIKEHISIDTMTEQTKDKLFEYVNQTRTYSYKRNIETRSGRKLWVNCILSLVSDGTSTKVYATVEDITEKINEENEKNNKINDLRRLVETSNCIYFEYDKINDRINYFMLVDGTFRNYGIENYVEYCRNGDIIQKEFRDLYISMLENTRKNKGPIEYVAKFAGSYQWYKTEYNNVANMSGEVVKITGQIININNEVIKRKEYVALIEKDQLSGLFNRITSQTYITQALNNKNKKYAFLMMDIDLFKSLNDNYGHPVGDKTIRKVADLLQKMFTNNDSIIGRFGGDEFVVFCEYETEEEIEMKVKLLLEKIQDISTDLNLARTITLSVGIALAPLNATTFDELFSKADKALYQSKTSGKNKMSWFNE